MRKLVNIQWLRAVACLLVVWTHAMHIVTFRDIDSFQTRLGYLERFGSVGVDIFFVISGFIVTLSASRYRSSAGFLVERIIRIWPLYLVATLAYLVVDPSDIFQLNRLVPSLFLIQPFASPDPLPTLSLGWTLMCEMWFYLALCAAMIWPGPRSLAEKVSLIIVGAILAASVLGFAKPMNVAGNPLALEFLAGVWIARIYGRRKLLPEWACMCMFVLGVVALLWTVINGEMGVYMAQAILIGPLAWDRVRIWGIGSALIVASAVFRVQPLRAGGIMVFLGDASYSIYLFHLHIVEAIRGRPDLVDSVPPDVAILLTSVLATAFGILCYIGIEKPLLRWAKKRRDAIGGAVATL